MPAALDLTDWAATLVTEYGVPLLDITVPTIPATQGSMKSIGGGRLVPDSSKLQPWRDAVTLLAKVGWRGRPPLAGAVEVAVLFAVPKPVSAPVNWREIPEEQYPIKHGSGDTDKLERAVLDGLADAKIYKNDAQVIDLGGKKRFADGPGCHLIAPGAQILLWELT